MRYLMVIVVILGCKVVRLLANNEQKGAESRAMEAQDQFTPFTWMPYSAPDVVQIVHLEILEPRHTTLWRAMTTLLSDIMWIECYHNLMKYNTVHCPHSILIF
ncbi:hypothetical protein Ahy_A10g047997 isoform A [Arachis hypogaea]|uniref:Secreted protein n=1 Tax=Arachis hypogaea TaxID=3818 RepID=A0A445B417_ARAHY|nr:hypothetical protein Ahy_A10g047997 isoform A [Arachis hypogaea]